MSIVFGFAGLRIKEDRLYFKPNLPKLWQELNFNLQYKGSILKITLKQGETIINVKGENFIKIQVGKNVYEVIKTGNIRITE